MPINRAVADNPRQREAAALFDLRGQGEQRAANTAAAIIFDGAITKKSQQELQPPDRTTRVHQSGLISRAYCSMFCSAVDYWPAVMQMKLSDACVETFVVALLF